MKTFIAVIGIFIKVCMFDGYVTLQSNNKYMWFSVDGGTQQMLKQKEIKQVYGEKITIGIN